MIIVLLALVNSIISVAITIKWKELRQKDVGSISTFGLFCAGLPLWIVTFFLIEQRQAIIYSDKYLAYLFGFITICLLSNLISIFILKFIDLSELNIYRLALSTLVALFVEISFFSGTLNPITLIGVLLLLTSGFLLPKNKSKKTKQFTTFTTLAILLPLSIIIVVQCTFYKNAIELQSSPLLHGMLAQLILYIVSLIICFKSLKADYSSGKIKISDFIFFGILVYIFTVNEAYLFKALSVTVLIPLAIFNILIFQVYDIKNKNLQPSWKFYLASFMAITAVVIINF